MARLTETDIAHIARLQREDGVRRLGAHFSWTEFSGSRRRFHQQFVHDVVLFAWTNGFRWRDVIRAAIMAKGFFPRIDGLDMPELLTLLAEALSKSLPRLPPVHQFQLVQYLMDTCVERRRLLQAVVGVGVTNISVCQGHLELEVPPRPLPLTQGTALEELEFQQRQTELAAALELKRQQLSALREGSGVTLTELKSPEGRKLDKKGVLKLVHAAVRTSGAKVVASLEKEATLVTKIMELRMQLVDLDTRRQHRRSPTCSVNSTRTSGVTRSKS